MTTDADDDWYEAERLHRAAAAGDLPELNRLVTAGHTLGVFDDLHYTPLHHAVANGQTDAARWLLEHGAPVDAHEAAKIGETALSLAVRGDDPGIVELLLQHGANPDITGWMGQTARTRARRRQDEPGRRIAALLARQRPDRR